MVDRDSSRGPSLRGVWHLRNLPGFRGRLLCLGTLSFAFLFAADRSTASFLAAVSRAFDSGLSAGISHHLLLLPQGILPRVFHGSAGLRRRRTQTFVLRRDEVPVHSSEPASLLLVCSVYYSGISLV